MQEVFRAIGRLSRSTVAVLITGETGTGKELVANALHKNSPRAKAPFIAINVAAIPKDLLESELFGHERGAFTGAQQRREGRFEQAHGGTLFLDEIGDMPIELGTRLLRVLAEGKFYRVGGNEPIKVDVRIIAATHQNLENLVQEGRFREDLYHRLNVIRIRLPALRQRQEDIPILMRHFLIQAAKELGVKTKSLLPKTVDILKQLPWQGNVRQLKNTALWLTVMASSQKIHPQDLPPELVEKSLTTSNFKDDWQTALRQWAKARFQAGQVEILNTAIPAFEAIMIETALQYTNGHKIEAAKCLGWGRNTLTRKIKEFNLE
jgi:two-component system nitrogen regulation response regulator GlnG